MVFVDWVPCARFLALKLLPEIKRCFNVVKLSEKLSIVTVRPGGQ